MKDYLPPVVPLGLGISIEDSNLWKSVELKSHHIRSDFLLFRLQSQNSSIDQSLNVVLEDEAFIDRMMHHPMKEAIIRIVRTSHFIRASNLW